jgi:isopenicillin N synthase-like dioxygenase
MASVTKFRHYPAFPADAKFAPLPRISLQKLFANDPDESKALFESCRSVGFFLLDLSGQEAGDALTQDIDTLLELAQQTMALRGEEKMKYHAKPPQRFFG